MAQIRLLNATNWIKIVIICWVELFWEAHLDPERPQKSIVALVEIAAAAVDADAAAAAVAVAAAGAAAGATVAGAAAGAEAASASAADCAGVARAARVARTTAGSRRSGWDWRRPANRAEGSSCCCRHPKAAGPARRLGGTRLDPRPVIADIIGIPAKVSHSFFFVVVVVL